MFSLSLSIIIPNLFVLSYAQYSPNIYATSLYNGKTIVLGNNVKNFVIVIPDEAHESPNQPKNQLPLTNQPYLPQHLVANVGTNCCLVQCGCGSQTYDYFQR